jgi:PHD/YefM family antitoxin component YafN of YafNO toxin-antitoxin module
LTQTNVSNAKQQVSFQNQSINELKSQISIPINNHDAEMDEEENYEHDQDQDEK